MELLSTLTTVWFKTPNEHFTAWKMSEGDEEKSEQDKEELKYTRKLKIDLMSGGNERFVVFF